PAFSAEQAITELGVGEALISMLDEKGRPRIVERGFVVPPASRLGPIDENERAALLASSIVAGVYEKVLDRESAYEKLRGNGAGGARTTAGGRGAARGEAAGGAGGELAGGVGDSIKDSIGGALGGALGGVLGGSGRKDSVIEAVAKSAARSIGSTLGREIIRGVLGSFLRKR
ncbi:MAG TPA: DUF853 family protein, partial [Quisquiliibacterium sp.]|nr:DUF853 family protein [Quisquiliibacterium sp.]